MTIVEIDELIIRNMFHIIQWLNFLSNRDFYTNKEFKECSYDFARKFSEYSEEDLKQIIDRLVGVLNIVDEDWITEIVNTSCLLPTPLKEVMEGEKFESEKETIFDIIKRLSKSKLQKKTYKLLKKYSKNCKCSKCKPAFIVSNGTLSECLNKEKEDDVIAIPVSRTMKFKFNTPKKAEFDV